MFPPIGMLREEEQLKDPDGFVCWQCMMIRQLKERHLYDVVDGRYQKPGPDAECPYVGDSLSSWLELDETEDEIPAEIWRKSSPLELWEDRNARTTAFIQLSLSDKMLLTVHKFEGTARELWLYLEKRYKPKGFLAAWRFLREFQNTQYH